MSILRNVLTILAVAVLAGCGDSSEETDEAAPTAATCTAESLLSQPPFAALDVSLFDPALHSGAPPMVPATREQVGERLPLDEQVEAALAERPGSDDELVARGLEVLNDPPVATIVVEPELRAALATLVGSVADPAVQAIRERDYLRVSFGPLTPPTIANFLPATREVVVAERYRHEDIRLLAVTLAHEVLHRDATSSSKEELVSNALEQAVWGRTLLNHPALAGADTELTRRQNGELMGTLNTRDDLGRQRLVHETDGVFPGGPQLASYGANFTPLGIDTPGSARLDAMLSAVTGKEVTGARFDDETIELLDTAQAWATPAERLQLLRTLRLDVPEC